MSFEKADAAFAASLDKVDESSEQAPEAAPESPVANQSPVSATPAEQVQQKIEEILDLDKHEKFRWGGKDWTRDELKRSTMLMRDYTQKTQKLSEEKKWSDNFAADMAKVLRNPDLITELNKIYPDSYKNAAAQLLREHMASQQVRGNSGEQTQATVSNQSNDFIRSLVSKVESLENNLTEILTKGEQAEYEKNLAEIDSITAELEKKYDLADTQAVIARIQVLADNGAKPTRDTWERVFKSSHETNQKRLDARQSKLIEEQKKASSKAQDMAPGGGIAGQAPKRMTMNEATEAAIAAFTRR